MGPAYAGPLLRHGTAAGNSGRHAPQAVCKGSGRLRLARQAAPELLLQDLIPRTGPADRAHFRQRNPLSAGHRGLNPHPATPAAGPAYPRVRPHEGGRATPSSSGSQPGLDLTGEVHDTQNIPLHLAHVAGPFLNHGLYELVHHRTVTRRKKVSLLPRNPTSKLHSRHPSQRTPGRSTG